MALVRGLPQRRPGAIPIQCSSPSVFAAYVLIAAASLPGAVVLTLMAGALFSYPLAVVLVSFASSLGATLAFISSRYLLGQWVQTRWGDRLQAINRGVEREGAFYLFGLRLVPLFPFF